MSVNSLFGGLPSNLKASIAFEVYKCVMTSITSLAASCVCVCVCVLRSSRFAHA